MTRENINASEFLDIVAIRDGDRIKRYEIKATDPNGFYRISEGRIETGKVYFPGKWKLENILADIARVEAE